ncbi:unnamed protein product [Discula destructiva]
MISNILLGGALLARLIAQVAAVPPFIARDEHCTATVTVYSLTTIYASLNPGEQHFTDSLNPDGARTVTVTATSVLTSVETQKIVQTQTVTQAHTIIQTQTVTQTVAQAASVQSAAVHGPLYEDPDGTTIAYLTVTSTLTTTLTISTPVLDPTPVDLYPAIPSEPAVPSRPTNPPHYSNDTQIGQYRNSSYRASAIPPVGPVVLSKPDLSPASTPVPLASAPPGPPPSYSNSSPTNYENGLYFVNWGIYGADFQPQSLPASQITRVYYAFADIGPDGTVKTSDSYADTEKHYPTDSWGDANSTSNAYGCVKQLFLLKQTHRNMKVLLSIGGWTYSSKFAPVAADAAARQNFANTAVALVTDYGFDGVDIDWEFNAYAATAADTANIVLLLQALRTTFDAWSANYAPGYHFLITVASPAGPATYGMWDLAKMDSYVDSWNLMAYDYAGAWGTSSAHSSNVYPEPANPNATPYNTDQAVTAYIAAGIAAAKIILGLPLYGRSFDGTSGLGEPYSTVGAGDELGAGQWQYKDLPRPGATEYYDNVAWAAYSYDSATAELVSYDNVKSTTEKSKYLMSRGLGGAMFWDASDDRNGSDSLVATMAGLLGPLDNAAENLLHFPTSRFTNIRNGLVA